MLVSAAGSSSAGTPSVGHDLLSATPFIVAAIALVGVVIAQVVTLAVNKRQGTQTRQAWVLDKRHDAYSTLFEATDALFPFGAEADRDAAWHDAALRNSFLSALRGLELIGPTPIRRLGGTAATNARTEFRKPNGNRGNVTGPMDQLKNLLREDLLPKQMR